jgi:5'-nucleotidase
MSWMQTYFGIKFDLLRPTPEMVDIRDIAHALAFQCRFNGHITPFYSVAQHSVHVAAHLHHLPARGRLQGLLHDAPEAYVGDMVRPLKNVMPIFKRIEEGVWLAICEKFDINPDLHPDVGKADNAMLYSEARDLHPIDRLDEWGLPEPPSELVKRVNALEPTPAERLFLESFEALMEEIEHDDHS